MLVGEGGISVMVMVNTPKAWDSLFHWVKTLSLSGWLVNNARYTLALKTSRKKRMR